MGESSTFVQGTMKSGKKPIGNLLQSKIVFQRRTERLDWRKIASIDIDNLIQEGDTLQLLELLNPVTFCKAETEFDHDKIDPGFIKVFRLSQLISECLLASYEKCIETVTDVEEKHNEIGKEKEKLSEEILHLKETLSSAKKELKKRKEMLASSQNEILGLNNSDECDQCPYCAKKFLSGGYLLAHIQRRHQGLPVNPLFPSLPPGNTVHHHPHHHPQQGVVSSYPHPPQSTESVLCRSSHQILPTSQTHFPPFHTPSSSLLYGVNQLAPANNNCSFSGSITSLNQIHSNQVGSGGNLTVGDVDRRDSCTQTMILANDVDPTTLVGALVEKYLEQKSASSMMKHVDDEDRHSSENNFSDSLNQPQIGLYERKIGTERNEMLGQLSPGTVDGVAGPQASGGVASSLRSRERVEVAELDVMRMQDEFEVHWQSLEEKVRQSGIEELKGAIMPPSSKEQEELRSTSHHHEKNLREEGEVIKSPAPSTEFTQFSENADVFKRHEIVDELKRSLQASVQDELKALISRLESQEQFWQDKLVSAQQNHEKQISQLRDELLILNPRNDDNPNLRVDHHASYANPDVFLEEKSQVEEFEGNADDRENVAPPGGIILVGPRGYRKPKTMVVHHHQQESPTSSDGGGAPRDTISGESEALPVAKPRKSRAIHSSWGEDISSALQSPNMSSKTHPQKIHNSQQQQRHEFKRTSSELHSISAESGSDEEPEYLTVMKPEGFLDDKHDNSIANQSNAGGEELKSDEVSDYTLSDSMEAGGNEETQISQMSFRKDDSEHQHQRTHKSIDHSRGKSSAKHASVKKKYIFDDTARKLVDAPVDEDDDDEEYSGKEDNLHKGGDDGKKGEKSQLDLVRAKTILELEQQMTDIGLNPESTAIGLEEMGRALKHLKFQRRASGDQINNFEKFEEERNAVKTLAKFEATKSSIESKLDAISSLSTKKTPQSSFVKIFSAVKTSGKNFRKRVASAVKKKHKHDDDDEAGDDGKSLRRKTASAPPLKTTFFSKARWARKNKKEENTPTKKEAESGSRNASNISTEESSEEIEVSPFMAQSKLNTLQQRDSRENSFRGKRPRSKSRPKSSKPLKRLNSNNSGGSPVLLSVIPAGASYRASSSSKTNKTNQEESPTHSRHSSESSPFSDVDAEETMHDITDKDDDDDNEKVGHFGSRHGNKQRVGEHEGTLLVQRKEQRNHKGDANELETRWNKGRTSQGEDDVSDRLESASDDWDDDDTVDKNPASGRTLRSTDMSGHTNNNADNENDIWSKPSDDRLQEIKKIIDKNKKEIEDSDTSFSNDEDIDEEDEDPDYPTKQPASRSGNVRTRESDEHKDFVSSSSRFISPPSAGESRMRPSTAKSRTSGIIDARARQNDSHFAHDELSNDESSFHDTATYTKINTNSNVQQGSRSKYFDSPLTADPDRGSGDRAGYRVPFSSGTGMGLTETESKKNLDSSEEIEEDIRELLNTTKNDEDEQRFKSRSSTNPIPHSSSSFANERSNFRRQPPTSLQPTMHQNMDYGGRKPVSRNNRARWVEQKKSPEERMKGGKSPTNSWDSWNSQR